MRVRWRDPRIAPAYAAVVAFAVVGVFGLVSGHPSTVPEARGVLVKVTLGPGETDRSVLHDVVVTVRGVDDPKVAESGRPDNTGTYQPKRSLAKQQVCLTVPAPYQVSAPRTTPEKDGQLCLDPVADEHQDIQVTLSRGAA
jgi:hypothetical protein